MNKVISENPTDIDTNSRDSQHKPKIGVALSSGAAKGLAHVGVIQVLEEHGIQVDAIAGTSMGAYVGALWAFGQNGADLEKRALEMQSGWDVIKLVDPAINPRRGFIHGNRIKKRIQKTIGDVQFGGLQKKLYVIATDLNHGKRKVFEEGHVATAVHASIAIPGIIRPVKIDGIEYVDGGLADPVAVSLLKENGMDIIIGVSVVPTVDEFEEDQVLMKKIAEEKNSNPMRRALSYVNQRVNYFADDNVLDILRRSTNIPQMKIAELALRKADIVLRPVLPESGFHNYSDATKYIEVGRKVALAKKEEIVSTIKNWRRDS